MKLFLISIVRWYQASSRSGVPSPFWFGGYSGCRSWPTCSEYMIERIEEEGALLGIARAVVRVARCHAWATSTATHT